MAAAEMNLPGCGRWCSASIVRVKGRGKTSYAFHLLGPLARKNDCGCLSGSQQHTIWRFARPYAWREMFLRGLIPRMQLLGFEASVVPHACSGVFKGCETNRGPPTRILVPEIAVDFATLLFRSLGVEITPFRAKPFP